MKTGKPILDALTEASESFAKPAPKTGAGEQETAVLNCRVRRNPVSLGGYHYHIEAGKKVYIFSRNKDYAMVATMPEADCISEDYFRVSISALDKPKIICDENCPVCWPAGNPYGDNPTEPQNYYGPDRGDWE